MDKAVINPDNRRKAAPGDSDRTEGQRHVPNGDLSSMDAHHLLKALPKELGVDLPPSDQPLKSNRASWAVTHRQVFKSAIAIALAVAFGWRPIVALLESGSVEAVVNARLIMLRAPIDGEIMDLNPETIVGSVAPAGTLLMRVRNTRIDRARVLDIARARDLSDSEVAAARRRLNDLRSLRADLIAQTALFKSGRIAQLVQRSAELRSKIAAAVIVRRETRADLTDYQTLSRKGLARAKDHRRAIRDDAIANARLEGLEHQLSALNVELTAMRQGRFVGDSYNDQPRSTQRADEIKQSIAEVSSLLQQKLAVSAFLTKSLSLERERLSKLSIADLHAPQQTRVWEMFTSPGEQVRRGQNLASLIDCSAAVVSAVVDEGVYNKLHLGDPATFRARRSGVTIPGTVIRLSGRATAQANLAISPSSMVKAPYRVLISVPGLADATSCDVGKTGKVQFQPGARASAHNSTNGQSS